MCRKIFILIFFLKQEVEVEDRTHFALLTPRSAAPMVILLVLNHMDTELDDTEWVINRLKADILSESAIDGMYIV